MNFMMSWILIKLMLGMPFTAPILTVKQDMQPPAQVIQPSLSKKNTSQMNLKHWKTNNGIPVTFYAAPDIPMLEIRLAFHAGSAYDGPLFGLGTLTAELLDQGTRRYTASDIAQQFADAGAQYQVETTRDGAILSLKTLTAEKALAQATHTFAEIIQDPIFPEQAFQRKRNQQVQSLLQAQESVDQTADNIFYQTLYDHHPYGHPIEGTLETLKQMTPSDVTQFYHTYFTANRAVLVMVGAIDEEKARGLANQLTEKMTRGEAPIHLKQPTSNSQPITREIPFHTTQTAIRIGQIGIDYHDPDYFPLLVGNYILGGGNLVSRLAEELREKKGLTYGVFSQFSAMSVPGPFVISVSTKNQQAKESEAIIRAILKNFIEKGPSEKELLAAKQYIVGSFPVSLSSNQNMAQLLLTLAFYKLPENYLENYLQKIQAVTPEAIQHAFQKHVHPESLVNIQVGRQ